MLVATAKSQLSDTSLISASSGNVKITSSLTSNITTDRRLVAAGSGAGIAVGVVVTDSEAFIDSTNATPVSAKNLTVSADTDDNAPTTGKSSPSGSKGNDTKSNSPTDNPANGGILGAVRPPRAARPTASRRPPTGTRTSAPRSP